MRPGVRQGRTVDASNLVDVCRTALEAELRACVGDTFSSFYDMVRYHLGWVDEGGVTVLKTGGKALRPILCLLSCRAVGGDYHKALPAAAAIEMMHNFSLIHDDIQDQSPQRRHRPTVWRVWGEPQAITAGDGLHVMAHLALLRLAEKGTSPDIVLATFRILDRACLDLCEGQHLDLSFEGQDRVSLDDYLTMVRKKTAALFDASTRIGALLGSGDERSVLALGDFGQELGLSFQIQDDVLGIWGMEETTGKPSLDDIRGRKKSLPIVHAMAKVQGLDRQRLEDTYKGGSSLSPSPTLSEDQVAVVLSILETAGSREFCRSLARSYWDRAIERLDDLCLEPDASNALIGLAQRLVERHL